MRRAIVWLKPLMGRRVREPGLGLSFWLAILSILATIHADVFEQSSEPVLAIAKMPLARILSPEPPPVDLSSLLGNPDFEASVPGNGKPPLYVFALDVSKSMKEQTISPSEAKQYQEGLRRPTRYEISNCLTPERGHLSGFDIARLELCRYLMALPDRSRAALWTFGAEPKLEIPPPDPLGARYLDIGPTPTGGHTKQMFFNAIAGLEPRDNRSNFESLLRIFGERYRDEVEGEDEVHFIIISDFAHDIGGHDLPDSSEGAAEKDLLQSRYRLSAFLIEERFRGLSRPGKTFHFSVVLGANKVFYSILPVAVDTIDWTAYKEVCMRLDRGRDDFDFLRPYQEADVPVVFYYTPGDLDPVPAAIRIDDERYKSSSLRLALASENRSTDLPPLKIKVSFKDAEGERVEDAPEGLVRMGRGYVSRTERVGDQVVLQPSTSLPAREAASYRLLISWNNGKKTNPAMHYTYAARVVFQKQLSTFGALAMAVSMIFVVVFGVWTLGAMWVVIRKRSQRTKRVGAVQDPGAEHAIGEPQTKEAKPRGERRSRAGRILTPTISARNEGGSEVA